MKNILTLLLLIISTNLFGQVKQEITKPVNYKFGVYYLDDQSVMFNTNGLVNYLIIRLQKSILQLTLAVRSDFYM